MENSAWSINVYHPRALADGNLYIWTREQIVDFSMMVLPCYLCILDDCDSWMLCSWE